MMLMLIRPKIRALLETGREDHLAAEDAAFQIGHNGDEEHRHDDDDPLPLAPFRLLHIQFDRSADLFHQ